MSRKEWSIVGVVVALGVLAYFFLPRDGARNDKTHPNAEHRTANVAAKNDNATKTEELYLKRSTFRLLGRTAQLDMRIGAIDDRDPVEEGEAKEQERIDAMAAKTAAMSKATADAEKKAFDDKIAPIKAELVKAEAERDEAKKLAVAAEAARADAEKKAAEAEASKTKTEEAKKLAATVAEAASNRAIVAEAAQRAADARVTNLESRLDKLQQQLLEEVKAKMPKSITVTTTTPAGVAPKVLPPPKK